MTLRFKVITSSSVSSFEKDVNDFMAANNVVDTKYSTSGSSLTAFITYHTKEDVQISREQVQKEVENMIAERKAAISMSGLGSFYQKDK